MRRSRCIARCGWHLPHVVVSAREWIADLHRAAPWIVDVPADHVHYLQEYTDVDAILQIATSHRLDAIYPGYAFLAENAVFAARVQQAGMRFIGPTPETLRAVGERILLSHWRNNWAFHHSGRRGAGGLCPYPHAG